MKKLHLLTSRFSVATIASIAAFSITAASALAQEYENTVFGRREKTEGSSTGSSSANATSNLPRRIHTETTASATSSIPLSDSPFSDSKWVFRNRKTGAIGVTHFRNDGTCSHFDSQYNAQYSWKSTITQRKTTNFFVADCGSNRWEMAEDRNVSIQYRRGYRTGRIWYRGETLPPVSPILHRAITASEVRYVSNASGSSYTFRSDGTFVERMEGQSKLGTWRGSYGNCIIIEYQDGEVENSFHFLNNYTTAYRFTDKIERRSDGMWTRVGPAVANSPAVLTNAAKPVSSSSSVAATHSIATTSSSTTGARSTAISTSTVRPSTTAASTNKVDSVSIQNQFEKIRAASEAEYNALLTKQNAEDIKKLERLKISVGVRDLDFAESIERRIGELRNGGSLDVNEPDKKAPSYENQLYSIYKERNRVLDRLKMTIGSKYKPQFLYLQKLAVKENNYTLAKEIGEAIYDPNAINSKFPEGLTGKWVTNYNVKGVGKEIFLFGRVDKQANRIQMRMLHLANGSAPMEWKRFIPERRRVILDSYWEVELSQDGKRIVEAKGDHTGKKTWVRASN